MISLLPPSSSALERAAELLADLRHQGLPEDLRALWSAERCPEELLPWLAWALSIDQWDAAWPVEIRRARVASAIAIQRRNGTRQSVEDVIASFGGNVAMREWFETDPKAIAHTFQLVVALGGDGVDPPTALFIDQVIAEVARTKPARSHFTFALALDVAGQIGRRAAALPLVLVRLTALANGDIAPPNALSAGGFALGLGGEYLTLGD